MHKGLLIGFGVVVLVVLAFPLIAGLAMQEEKGPHWLVGTTWEAQRSINLGEIIARLNTDMKIDPSARVDASGTISFMKENKAKISLSAQKHGKIPAMFSSMIDRLKGTYQGTWELIEEGNSTKVKTNFPDAPDNVAGQMPDTFVLNGKQLTLPSGEGGDLTLTQVQ